MNPLSNRNEDDPEWQTVRKVQAGQVESFEILVKNHEKSVFNFLCHFLGNYHDAEEVAQDVFIAAYRSIGQFRGESRFSTWLFRIATNQAKNRKKRMTLFFKRHVSAEPRESDDPSGPEAQVADPTTDPEKLLSQKEIQTLVQSEIQKIKPDDAAIILLRDLEERSYNEIAAILDIPEGTAKSRLHRARLALKERLAPYFKLSGHEK